MMFSNQRILTCNFWITYFTILRFSSDGKPFTLQSLANLAIFADTNKHQLNPHLFCADATSQIIEYLQNCNDIHQLRYVSIYYTMLSPAYMKSISSIHKTKMNSLMKGLNLDTELKPLLDVRISMDEVLKSHFHFGHMIMKIKYFLILC